MIGIGDVIILIVALLAAAVFLNPRMLNWTTWRAIVTPLASIIGSGFLVAGPILSHATGNWAWLAMMGLCAVGYFFGAIIRHNILHVEPLLNDHPTKLLRGIEGISNIALSLAYFVSVAYYLNLFSAFALRGGGIIDEFWIKVVATLVIITIGLMGLLRGLRALERLETLAVGIKLSLIVALCAGLFALTILAINAGNFSWSPLEHETGLYEMQVLLGLVILVQGFETSRYLGAEYSAEVRVSTMRKAQWIATGVYLVFMLLVTQYFTGELPPDGGETQIIDLLRPVGLLVAPLIIVMALASQLSAAVADLNGAGGLIAETSGKRFSVKTGYLVTAIFAIFVTWIGNIYEIITLASKAFVLYYGLQSLQATLSALRIGGKGRVLRALFFGFGVLLSLVIIIFAVPAGV